uniref:Uncharacterized protein n=1 Tax=Stomoxys calcitrans TaxID=35570 RepID=A0A1I8QAU1_STOCA
MELHVVVIGLLVLQGSLEGLALQCHQCKNTIDGGCFEFEKGHTIFLNECDSTATACVTEVKTKAGVEFVRRACKTSAWKCEGNCYTCHSDGCNYRNDDFQEVTTPRRLKATTMELITGNIYPIMGLGLLVTLLLVWIIIKVCCSNKDDEYEDEYYDEEDEDVEYDEEEKEMEDYDEENEEDYEEDYDSIEKEYHEYAQDAEDSYNKLKGDTVIHI